MRCRLNKSYFRPPAGVKRVLYITAGGCLGTTLYIRPGRVEVPLLPGAHVLRVPV